MKNCERGRGKCRIQNSEFRVKAKQEDGLLRLRLAMTGKMRLSDQVRQGHGNFFGGGVAGRRNLICFFWKIERLVLF